MYYNFMSARDLNFKYYNFMSAGDLNFNCYNLIAVSGDFIFKENFNFHSYYFQNLNHFDSKRHLYSYHSFCSFLNSN